MLDKVGKICPSITIVTSSAGSATLGDSSLAKLTTELTRWGLPGSQLCLYSKKVPSVVTAQNYMGGHRTEKTYTLMMGGSIGFGTPHIDMAEVSK